MISARLELKGERVAISPDGYLGSLFNSYRGALEDAGARYEPATKASYVNLDQVPLVVKKLGEVHIGAVIEDSVRTAIAERAAMVRAEVADAKDRTEMVDAALRARGLALFPFQRLGVAWLAPRKKAALFDEMGLGKTIQALTAAPLGAPMLVVCPAVAKGNWVAEAARWRPDLTPVMLKGRASFRWPRAGEMVVTNKDILADEPGEAPGDVVVVADEAHVYKNPKARCTKRFRALSRAAQKSGGRVWLLTGTPLLGKRDELWNVLEAADLAREAFGSYFRFSRLMGGSKGRFGMEWGGMVSPEVPELLRRVSLQRRRLEVLPDLPTKIWRTVEVECVDADKGLREMCDEVLEALRKYAEGRDMTVEDAIDEVQRTKDGVLFEQIARVRHRLAIAKIPALSEMIEEREENGVPCVVFSAHRAPIESIIGRAGWGQVTGSIGNEQRHDTVKMFQEGRLNGIAATIQAGGVAITLTHANEAIFVDLDWTPALNAQAEDRVCRIGQTRGVIITRIQADHALDEHVNSILDRKQRLISASVEASAVITPASSDEHADRLEAIAEHLNPAGARPERPKRRLPQNATEAWAARAIAMLAALDPDHAFEENGIGFNKLDGEFGHSLAKQVPQGLTDKQWSAAIRLASRYPRQVGRPQ